ncbi:dihydroneopterin aldolase [Sphingomonas ginkgonis]|uniref:dihydroneopterin aldolase n=1 Tax=Sphingomonas ginkgonis TaxID=2315330 RepID=A0A429VE65_9SPHN|nr:dihydroneopterin aldolase [Sphingomonas ginkgonis]
MEFTPRLDGLVPATLRVKQACIHLDSLEVMADIGFHQFEIGTPQRLLVSVEVWLEALDAPADDAAVNAWDYDVLRTDILALAARERWNLQETLANKIFALVAARAGVSAIRVSTTKPDIYPDARGVGVVIASFTGEAP